MKKSKLSPPWYTYLSELQAMFEEDSDISIKFDEDAKTIYVYVAKTSKAEALNKILKHSVTFGKVTLSIEVVPPNEEDADILEAFDEAFMGNPALSFTIPIKCPIGIFRYAVFKNKVVQFYNDQLDDLNGNKSTLYQEIAKDIFADDLDVNFCTDTKDPKLTKPLGEWP